MGKVQGDSGAAARMGSGMAHAARASRHRSEATPDPPMTPDASTGRARREAERDGREWAPQSFTGPALGSPSSGARGPSAGDGGGGEPPTGHSVFTGFTGGRQDS